jgi:hypothetical protein
MSTITDQPRQSGGMDWFYRILDVEYGVELAVRDAQRVRTWQGASFSLIINVLLLTAFGGVWLRYDLWSTITVFAPVRDNILEAIPEGWAAVRQVGGFLLGIAAAFLTSLIQWSYPRLARRHEAALWGLAAASIFDIATDYRDVQADFPSYFDGLIGMFAAQGPTRWLIAGGVCLFIGILLAPQRGLLWIISAICFACVLLPAAQVWTWGIVFIGTIFASFVAQSLVVIHAAKALALLSVGRGLRAEGG